MVDTHGIPMHGLESVAAYFSFRREKTGVYYDLLSGELWMERGRTVDLARHLPLRVRYVRSPQDLADWIYYLGVLPAALRHFPFFAPWINEQGRAYSPEYWDSHYGIPFPGDAEPSPTLILGLLAQGIPAITETSEYEALLAGVPASDISA